MFLSITSLYTAWRATWSGNLCNASPAADAVPALIACDAKVVVAGPKGERTLPVAGFTTGPGTTVLERGQFDEWQERLRAARLRAVRLRRSEPNEAEQFLQQLLGLRIDRHRAEDAASFCGEVDRRWGAETLQRLWEDPSQLPHLEELTDPVGWAARVLLD